MTLLEVRLPPDQLVELADLIAARIPTTTTTPAPIKLAYSISEAASATSMTDWQIRTAITRGELHAKQAGQRGRYSIPHEALMTWLRGTPDTTVSARKGVRQTRKTG